MATINRTQFGTNVTFKGPGGGGPGGNSQTLSTRSGRTAGTRQVNPHVGGIHSHPMGTSGATYGPSHTHGIPTSRGQHSGWNAHSHGRTLPSTAGANPGHTHPISNGTHGSSQYGHGTSHLHSFGQGGTGQFTHGHNPGSMNIYGSGHHQHSGGAVMGGNTGNTGQGRVRQRAPMRRAAGARRPSGGRQY